MPSIFITLTGEVDNKLLILVEVAGEGAVDGTEWKIKTFLIMSLLSLNPVE